MFVLPHLLGVKEVLSFGVMVSVRPVHARRAERWRSLQSVVPSSCRMQNVVCLEGVEIRAVYGVGDVMRW